MLGEGTSGNRPRAPGSRAAVCTGRSGLVNWCTFGDGIPMVASPLPGKIQQANLRMGFNHSGQRCLQSASTEPRGDDLFGVRLHHHPAKNPGDRHFLCCRCVAQVCDADGYGRSERNGNKRAVVPGSTLHHSDVWAGSLQCPKPLPLWISGLANLCPQSETPEKTGPLRRYTAGAVNPVGPTVIINGSKSDSSISRLSDHPRTTCGLDCTAEELSW